MNRRKFIVGAGTGTAIAVAGCSGNGGEEDSDPPSEDDGGTDENSSMDGDDSTSGSETSTDNSSTDGNESETSTDDGSTDDADGTTTYDTSSGEAVVAEYYGILGNLDADSSVDEVLEAIDPVLHSASILPGQLERLQRFDLQPVKSAESLETEMVNENLTADQADDRFQLSRAGVSQSELATIASENQVIRVTFQYPDSGDREGINLTATENGEWRIVI